MAIFNKKAKKAEIEKQKAALKQFHHATIVSKTIIDQVEHLTTNGVGKVDDNQVEFKYLIQRAGDVFGMDGDNSTDSTVVATLLNAAEQVGVFKVIYDSKNIADNNTVTYNAKYYKVINLKNNTGNVKGYYDAFKEQTIKIASTIANTMEGPFKALFHSGHHQVAGDFVEDNLNIINKSVSNYTAASNLNKETVYSYCLQQGDNFTDHCELLNPDNNVMINELFFE